MKKVLIELEIQDNFRPCQNDTEAEEKSNCPFSSWNEGTCSFSCGYNAKFDCPMQNMKTL